MLRVRLYVGTRGCTVTTQNGEHGFIRDHGWHTWSELWAKLRETDCTVEIGGLLHRI